MASKISINLDTSKENFLVNKCKQNDDLTLEAYIYENGAELDLTNKEIIIQALKSNNTYVVQNTNIIKENNKILAELDRDFSRVSGTTKIEIVLVESGKQNTTFSFYLEVSASVISGAVESSNTVTILEELQDKIVEAGAVKEETEQLITSGGAATTGDIANINAQLEQKTSKAELEIERQRINNIVAIPQTGDNTETRDIRVGIDGSLYSSAGDAVRGQVNGLYKSLDYFINDVSSINILNPLECESGYIKNNGDLAVSSDYWHTPKIKVKQGDIVRWFQTTSVVTNPGIAYNSLGQFVGLASIDGYVYGKGGSGRFVYNEFTVPSGYVSVVLNISKVRLDEGYVMVTVNNSYPTTIIPYERKVTLNSTFKQVEEIEALKKTSEVSKLYGKKIITEGDSIVYGAGYTGGFAKIIADKNGMLLTNNAVSGATLAIGTLTSSGGNRHWISDSITSLPTDGDYYIFDGGINDTSITVPVENGTITDSYSMEENAFNKATICGAMEYICRFLVTQCVGKKIGYIFPHRIKPTVSRWETARPLLKQILAKWGIPYLDLQEITPPLNFIDTLKNNYTANADGWHPNQQGYELFYVPKIEAWIKTL